MTPEESDQINAEMARLHHENDVLRAIAAKHGCVYGHMNASGVCELGYPGCACADDIFVGEETLFDMWRNKVEVLKENLANMLSWGSCSCDHPACKRCKETKEAREALLK